MKYKIKKSVFWKEIWDIIEIDEKKIYYPKTDNDISQFLLNIPISFLIKDWYIEEVKEKPKFKVWDYAVVFDAIITQYIKIIEIYKANNGEYFYNWNQAKVLRKPTEEELKLYFR